MRVDWMLFPGLCLVSRGSHRKARAHSLLGLLQVQASWDGSWCSQGSLCAMSSLDPRQAHKIQRERNLWPMNIAIKSFILNSLKVTLNHVALPVGLIIYWKFSRGHCLLKPIRTYRILVLCLYAQFFRYFVLGWLYLNLFPLVWEVFLFLTHKLE